MAFNGASYGAALTKINGVATGLTSTSQNADGTVNVTYADGNTYTTPNIKGDKGDTGSKGDKGDPGAKGDSPTTTEVTAIVESVFDEHKSEFVTPTQMNTAISNAIGGALNGTY